MFIASTVVLSSSKLLLGTGASETVPILADGDAAGGFQRYCLKRIVQGPRFEETKNDPTVTRVGYSKSCIRASTAVIMVVIITILMVVIIMVVIISSSNSSNNNNGSILGRENMVGVNMLLAYYPQHTLYLRISISISVTFCWCPAVSTVLQGSDSSGRASQVRNKTHSGTLLLTFTSAGPSRKTHNYSNFTSTDKKGVGSHGIPYRAQSSHP